MVNVQFKAIKAAKCAFCGKEKEDAFDVCFAEESISGSFCKNCFLRMVRMQIGVSATNAPAKVGTNNPASFKGE
jgi:hypothetical protein